jgi:hypothetical protein
MGRARWVSGQTDLAFVRRLAELRRGECSDATADFLTATAGHVVGGNGIEATLLHSHNESVGPALAPSPLAPPVPLCPD